MIRVVPAVEPDPARRGGNELEYGQARSGFAAAAFPDNAQGLSFGKRQRDPVHRIDCSGPGGKQSPGKGKMDFKIVYLEQRGGILVCLCHDNGFLFNPIQCQHRTQWPLFRSVSSGICVLQISMALSHRG